MPKINPALLNPDEYPSGLFEPLHPAFKGKCRVERHGFPTDEPPFKVNLSTGECSCEHGAAFVWYVDQKVRKWIPNRYCVHKLKAIADIIQQGGHEQEPDWMFPFMKAVATRYNQFEVVSAFHKHLRRGAVDRAYFFACILCTTRGVKGIIKYLLAIVYEETRDHALREYLMELMAAKDNTFLSMAKAITWFCETKKKWDLASTRLRIFEHEQRGYQRLVKEFGRDVAKAQEIIDADMVAVFQEKLVPAIRKDDYDTFQYALKGIQKSQFPDGIENLHQLRLSTVKKLKPAIKYVPAAKQGPVLEFYKYLITKPEEPGISYHDLNCFGDMLCGEPYAYGVLPEDRQRAIKRLRVLPAFPFDKFPPIPLYAHDNHTYRGKALLRTYAGQAMPGVEQTGLDLRGCGAYLGVAWRYLAVDQHGTISVPWHEVKFPKWLASHLMDMWYVWAIVIGAPSWIPFFFRSLTTITGSA